MEYKIKNTALTLSVLALTMGQCYAQSNVTLYGIVDLGYLYDKTEGQSAINSLNSGNQSASRFGLKGVEDLGGGLKANFVLENGFKADTGMQSDETKIFDRWAYAGLENQYGEVRLGRQWTLGREWTGADASPFGISFGRSASGTTFGYNDADFSGIVDNVVMYRSPKMNGFEFAAGYSLKIEGDEEAGDRNNHRLWMTGLRYRKGPLRLSLSYERVSPDQRRVTGGNIPKLTNYSDTGTSALYSDRNAQNLQLAGSYDFNVARIYAGIGYLKNPNRPNAYRVAIDNDTAWTVGARVPMWGGALLASYQKTNHSKIRVAALGYTYDLSKRTNFYVFYNLGTSTVIAQTTKAGTAQGTETDRTQFSMGLRHNF